MAVPPLRLSRRAGRARPRSYLVPPARRGSGARVRRGALPARPLLRGAGQGARRVHRLQELRREIRGERGHLVLDRVRFDLNNNLILLDYA